MEQIERVFAVLEAIRSHFVVRIRGRGNDRTSVVGSSASSRSRTKPRSIASNTIHAPVRGVCEPVNKRGDREWFKIREKNTWRQRRKNMKGYVRNRSCVFFRPNL